MTAEIAILNKSAVALAADSKVTLSHNGKQKTYDTVNKLFSLSKNEPVGAMIYGNAEFMGFPWETIIKEYRRQKPDKCFDTIFDWSDDFKQYLTSFFPFKKSDEEHSAIRVARSWIQYVIDKSYTRAIIFDEANELISNEIDQILDNLSNCQDFLTKKECNSLKKSIVPELKNIISVSLGPHNCKKNIEDRLLLLAETALRKLYISPASSGLVLAGFGEKELLPSLYACEIDGILFGKLRFCETRKFDASRKAHGLIHPFAQTDMVYRFMEGIDPHYVIQLYDSIHKLLMENILEAAKSLGHSHEEIEKLTPAFQMSTNAAVEMFFKTHNRIRREQFATPILDMVRSLPKDELANLAESLVSLTSLQRRVSHDIETVGGAIDVAVISKGDGFVWIKRKHYFQPDRNIRFVNGYFKELNEAAWRHRNDDDDAKA